MATIKLLLRGTKEVSKLTVRFVNGRNCNLFVTTGIQVNRNHWDANKEQLRNISSIPNRLEINAMLAGLKASILNEFNLSYMSGGVIDKNWVSNKISEYFKRPSQEVKNKIEPHYVYYTDFANWWLKNYAPKWKTSSKSYLKPRAIAQYKSFVSIFETFKNGSKTKINSIDDDFVNSFVDFMESNQGYAPQTVKRHLGRLRFFINRAKTFDIKINSSYNERVYIKKDSEDIPKPYLSPSEIDKVYNLDLSHDMMLDNARDSFIIGLWSGLRISDFNNNLDISNIKDGFIEIKTKKTNTWVTIPLHPHIKAILSKRFNNLPSKVSKFNKKIKTICMLCGIDQPTKGKLFDKETKRNKTGVYPKYKLISSHVCRRSFCSNLFGKVHNSVIQKAGGWASEAMMLHYMKKTNKEHAIEIDKYWKSQED